MKTIFRTMFLAGAVVMMASCGNAGKKADALVEVDTVPSVSVVKVGVQEVPQEVTYTSTVQPFVKNNIVPQAGNRIKKINVEVGDFVKKGQILAEMDLTQRRMANCNCIFSGATALWCLNESTLRKAITYGKLVNGVDVCKYGKQWVISSDAMVREYGQPKMN